MVHLYVFLSLIRHLCAGSGRAKFICGEARLFSSFKRLLIIKHLPQPVALETIECIRNMLANHDDNKSRIWRRGNLDKGLLDICKDQYLSNATVSDALFNNFADLLKMLAIHQESRIQLHKGGYLGLLMNYLGPKAKPNRVKQILQVFTNISLQSDGQLLLTQIPDFFQILTALLEHSQCESLQSIFILLRNLAALRENKVYFIANGTLHSCRKTIETSQDCYCPRIRP